MSYYFIKDQTVSGLSVYRTDNPTIIDIASNGVTVDTIMLTGSMRIGSGGKAINTSLTDWGWDGDNYITTVSVFKGGVAIRTYLSCGEMYVTNAGVASETQITGGHMYVSSGGTAYDTNLNNAYNGRLYVCDGGVVSNTVASGDMYVSSGGTAVHNSIFFKTYNYSAHGSLTVETGGYALFNSIFSRASMNVLGRAVSNYASKGTINVYDGGTTTQTILDNGSMLVSSGGEASHTTLRGESYLTVEKGGYAFKPTVYDGGTLLVSGGGVQSAVLSSGARATVMSSAVSMYDSSHASGYMVSTIVSSGALFQVLSGSVASKTVVNGGEMYVVSNALAKDNVLSNNAQMNVGYNGEASITTVDEDGKLFVKNGGAVDSTYLTNSGGLFVSSGGTANRTSTNVGILSIDAGARAWITDLFAGSMYVRGTASMTTLEAEGSMYVYSGGTAERNFVSSGGRLYVSSGGTANSTTLYDNGMAYISSGALANYADVSSGGRLYVYAGASAKTVWVEDQGTANVSGGTVRSAFVYSGGKLNVSSGGSVTDITLFGARDGSGSQGGALFLDGASGESATVNPGGRLIVSSGGVQNGAAVLSGGRLSVRSGGKITGMISLDNGADVTVSSGGIVDFDLTWLYGQATPRVNDLSLVKGSPSFTITMDLSLGAGTYTLAGGAAGFNKTITVKDARGTTFGTLTVGGEELDVRGQKYTLNLSDEGVLSVTLEGVADNTIFTGDLTETKYISSGSSAVEVNVNDSGNLIILTGGVASQTAVNSGGSLQVSSGGTAGLITVNAGGIVVVFDQGFETHTEVFSGGSVRISSGGSGNSIKVNDFGEFQLFPGGKANNTVVGSAGTFIVEAGGTAHYTVIEGKGQLLLDGEGAVLDGLTVSSGGKLWIAADSGTVRGKIRFESGALVDDYFIYGTNTGILDFSLEYVSPDEEALVNDLSFVLDKSFAYSLTIRGNDARGVYKLAEGAAGFKKTVTVKNVFNAELGTLKVGAWEVIDGKSYVLNLNSDGLLTLTIGRSDEADLSGDLTSAFDLTSGMTALYVNINSGGILNVLSGGTAGNTTLNAGGSMNVSNGGEADKTILYGGRLNIRSGGAAYETEIQSALVNVSAGGIANLTTINQDGVLILDYKGAASDTTINSGGHFEVFNSGMAADTTVNKGGHLYIYSGGTATNATINAGGTADVSSGVINGAIVNSGGSLLIYSGAMLTGRMTFESGAEVIPFVGSILDFDLAQTSAGSVALVNDLSILLGTPTYTLTVSTTQANGTYNLAGGAAGFNKTITVKSSSTGEALGTLSVGQTVNIGDTGYTLNLDGEDVLFVTVSAAVPEPVAERSFYTGDFNGDLFDTLAVQSGSMVTIYQNGEPWGLGVTLDPGWNVVGTGDFDGNHIDDFLRVNGEGYVVGELSNGNGTFTPQVLNLKNAGWDILGTGDFNGNGTSDVLIANPTGASETIGLLGYWESGVTWTLINGYSAEWECVSTGDFNADGKCDMLWRNQFVSEEDGLTYNAYCTWIVENEVDWRMVSVANPSEWDFLCSGDFDGNGSHDIAMINDVGVVGIWGVNDGYLSSWSILSAVNTAEWKLAGVGDFNADGTDDIAWCNCDTGLAGYWQINNKELTTWTNIATVG